MNQFPAAAHTQVRALGLGCLKGCITLNCNQHEQTHAKILTKYVSIGGHFLIFHISSFQFPTSPFLVLMVTQNEMKLSTHTYYMTLMTLSWFPWQPAARNSLKPFSLSTHSDDTHCACILRHSVTTINQKWPRAFFRISTSSLLNKSYILWK